MAVNWVRRVSMDWPPLPLAWRTGCVSCRVGADPAANAAGSPTWSEVQAALDEELQKLSDHHRAAFVLCVLEGKSVPEAAAALGCKSGTASSWLTRARQRLRVRLALYFRAHSGRV